jgi:biofilm PGA synthesis N-glycosyltransferase PgaC
MNYVLITAAHNEEAYIEETIRSVLSQSVPPLKWILVSDASTDRTDEIVEQYASENPIIQLHRLEANHKHSFGAQARALAAGYECVKGLEFEFIATLDGDVSFESDYFAELLRQFQTDQSLGLTGGFIYEKKDGVFQERRGNRTWSVAGATQFFRRECYEAIGGIQPLEYGGHDWHAEASVHMLGWTSKAVPELKVYHHRGTGTARSLLRHWFRQGKMDYSLGSLPAFEVLKCFLRFGSKPFVIGGLARLAGFACAFVSRPKRTVSDEFVRFLQKQQRERLSKFFFRGRRRELNVDAKRVGSRGVL